MNKHCCESMNRHLGQMCEEHSDPCDCPDCVISYSDVFDEYGLIIHDGGSSSHSISYCPFCGSKLPESKRDRWFEELARLGFESPIGDDNIPEKYKSSSWFKNT